MTYPPCGRSCDPCRPPPPRPPKPQSVLLQKILCCDEKHYPNLCVALQMDDIPRCRKPPFTLEMVQQSGAQPWWTPLENQSCRAGLQIRVTIPVCCQLRDACGQLFSAMSEVCVECGLSPACPPSECWRHQLVFSPCVRLKGCPPVSTDGCFEARLEATLAVYMTKPTPCQMHKPKPDCPELPLYPQPRQPPPSPRWQRCPEDRGPCGWPRQG